MNFNKFRKACQPIRVTAGVVLISVGFYTNNPWFFLGILPMVAGLTNFCPLCMVTKKCNI